MTKFTGWQPRDEAPLDQPIRVLVPATFGRQQSTRRAQWDEQTEMWYDSYGTPVEFSFFVPYRKEKAPAEADAKP